MPTVLSRYGYRQITALLHSRGMASESQASGAERSRSVLSDFSETEKLIYKREQYRLRKKNLDEKAKQALSLTVRYLITTLRFAFEVFRGMTGDKRISKKWV